jgi:hypothetical protein
MNSLWYFGNVTFIIPLQNISTFSTYLLAVYDVPHFAFLSCLPHMQTTYECLCMNEVSSSYKTKRTNLITLHGEHHSLWEKHVSCSFLEQRFCDHLVSLVLHVTVQHYVKCHHHHHHHLFTVCRSLFGNNTPLDVEIVIHIIKKIGKLQLLSQNTIYIIHYNTLTI